MRTVNVYVVVIIVTVGCWLKVEYPFFIMSSLWNLNDGQGHRLPFIELMLRTNVKHITISVSLRDHVGHPGFWWVPCCSSF